MMLAEKNAEIDNFDRDIIRHLQVDARLSYRELGERVFLSANTVAERVRRLLQDKVVLGFHARVDMAVVDLPLQALVDVKLSRDTTAAHFESVITTIRDITEATLMTGNYDYMLRVACRDQADLVRVIEDLRAHAGVQDTTSRLVLRHIDLLPPLLPLGR